MDAWWKFFVLVYLGWISWLLVLILKAIESKP